MTRSAYLVLLLMYGMTGVASSDASRATPVHIQYAKHKDTLSLRASDAHLTVLLRDIALVSALDIKADPSIEKDVTVAFQDKPLETALRELLLGLNVAYVYSEHSTRGKPLLVAVRVLPAGVDNHRLAVPLTTPEAAAAAYAGQRVEFRAQGPRKPLSAAEFDDLERRWQYRMRRLAVDQRRVLEKIIADSEKFDLDQRAQNDRSAQQAMQQQERQREEGQRTETQLMELDPSRYALREARRQQLIRQSQGD